MDVNRSDFFWKEKSEENSHRISIKRSNARVGNLRVRTKSENGILCGDGECCTIMEGHHTSQMEQCLLAVEKEALAEVRLRPAKRRLCVGTDELKFPKESEDVLVVTAIYGYSPSQEDELALYPGDKVRVLSEDYRDSGTEGWWVGLRDSRVGVFPVSYVSKEGHFEEGMTDQFKDKTEKTDLPRVTPRTPNESFRIPLSQDCLTASDGCDRNNIVSGNGFALSGTTGVRMISSLEITKMECLGSGAFGVVYHGRWQNKEVAVKTFSMHANEVHIYQEAGHLSCLLHPNIVRLFGVSIINDMGSQIALIMEYARGGALHNFLHFGPKIRLSPHTLLQMSKQIALGMRYLHKEAGICHRDLKSSNVLIKETIPDYATDTQIANCTLLITDFGMARRTAELVSQQSKLGTLAYAAPEVCKQQGGFTVKSDVWSYGVLLWELLTMEIPFRDIEQPHLLYKIAIKNHTLHIPSGIPSLLVNLLTSCWNEERDLRPDFEDVSQVLKRAQKCKFMEISAEEFYSIQETWREEIRLSEKFIEESMTSSDTERDEFIEQQREIEYAKEELQRREEDMQRREAACSQAMGTVNQFKLLFSVLVANQLPRISNNDDQNNCSHSPPVPPPRKRPFVGRLKFWSHTNNYSSASRQSPDPLTTVIVDDTNGNPNISAPSNLQHVVHISKQDFNLASPALRFFPDSMKMHTWGPQSQGKSIFNLRDRLRSTDEADQEQINPPNKFRLEDLSLQMDYTDSAGSPSPCVETPSSTCGITIQGESNLCSSAPNLRKISLGNLPVFEFSSFRRPIYEKMEDDSTDPPAIANCPSCYFKWLDHRKKIPCERCKWRGTNRSATIGPMSKTQDVLIDKEIWSCIPKCPPESFNRGIILDNDKKMISSCNSVSKKNKKSRNRRHNKTGWSHLDHAMWSIMRMLSAVVLPDRNENVTCPLVDASISHELLSTLVIPEKAQEVRESCSPTLSLDITTEDEDHSSGGTNDNVFHPSLYNAFFNQKTPPITPSKQSNSTKNDSIKPALNTFKASSLPKPSTLKSFSRRTKPSNKSDKHCKFKNIQGVIQNTGRGSSVPPSRRPNPSFDIHNSTKQSEQENPNYFASWLPFANSQVDLKNGSHSIHN